LISAILIGLLVYQIMSHSKEKAATDGVDFRLLAVDGKEYSLLDFRGKKVLLNFFCNMVSTLQG